MTNDELYDRAREAIADLFGDQSVSAREAISNLESLKGEIDIMISALESDLSRQ